MIRRIRMKNFRRFQDQTIDFDGISYIEGQNNAGKTTIFLAIEYALFGNVTGFRSQAALFQPGEKKMGVEMVYTGRNGRKYKLQRMHQLKGKGATGHYTLKEILGEDGERYILSSDFAGSSEEMLQLQIIETLGISKRLFDVALNIKQGEITSILEGNKYLDIVLGVSAASLAQKQLNSVALGFEKETSQYDTLKASQDGLRKERQELERQQQGLDAEIKDLQKRSDGRQETMETAKSQQKQLEPVMQAYGKYQQLCSRWDRAHERLHEHLVRVQKAEKEAGSTEKIKEELATLEKMKEKAVNAIEEYQGKISEGTKALRSLEQQLGDLKGKISRRQNLPKGEATCEECGAPIDQQRVKQELKAWSAQQEDVISRIKNSEATLNSLQENMSQERSTLQETVNKISQFRTMINHLQQLEEEMTGLKQQLEKEEEILLDGTVDLYEQLQLYNEEKTENQKITIPRPEIMDLETLVTLDKEVIMARSMSKVYSNKLPQEAQKLQQVVDDAQVELRVTSSQLEDRKQQKDQLQPRIQQVNKELADTKSQMQLLEKKRGAAERMRTAAKVFKSLQTALRDQAASSLAKKTLQYHRQLAETEEYSALTVDPKNYSIYVTPKDIGEEVPASTYQGGGHKLLLGIAFKLAIVNVVTKPPFILLDEPTYGLDSQHKSALFDRIDKLAGSQLLLITHQRDSRPVDGTLYEVKREGDLSSVEVVA